MSIQETLKFSCDLCGIPTHRHKTADAARKAGWLVQVMTAYCGVRVDVCPHCVLMLRRHISQME